MYASWNSSRLGISVATGEWDAGGGFEVMLC